MSKCNLFEMRNGADRLHIRRKRDMRDRVQRNGVLFPKGYPGRRGADCERSGRDGCEVRIRCVGEPQGTERDGSRKHERDIHREHQPDPLPRVLL